MKTWLAAVLFSLAAAGEGRALDGTEILLVGNVEGLTAFEALIGGEEIETATDFGFIQAVDDGFAIRAVRTRVGPDGLRTEDCEGGLAPTILPALFEGAYFCGGEVPVPISYQPKTGKVLPNMVDPNGTWAEEGFFVSSILSIKVTPAIAVGVSLDALRPLVEDAPETLDGLIGRVSPPRVQKSGACGEDVAVFFPLAGLPACADADLF